MQCPKVKDIETMVTNRHTKLPAITDYESLLKAQIKNAFIKFDKVDRIDFLLDPAMKYISKRHISNTV